MQLWLLILTLGLFWGLPGFLSWLPCCNHWLESRELIGIALPAHQPVLKVKELPIRAFSVAPWPASPLASWHRVRQRTPVRWFLAGSLQPVLHAVQLSLWRTGLFEEPTLVDRYF